MIAAYRIHVDMYELDIDFELLIFPSVFPIFSAILFQQISGGFIFIS